MNDRSARFRALFRQGPFICMSAHDALAAKFAEQAGAPVIFASGFSASAIVAGQPDVGVLTQTDVFEYLRRICRATTLPVFADADTGYGGPFDAPRTIQLWEEAGASCLHLEDQVMPKKCGHFAGKQLVPKTETVQKLRAMLDARRDPNFFVVARTDAIAVTGLDDAPDRLEAYAAAGADGLYADAPTNVEMLAAISRRLRSLGKPLLFNMASAGKSSVLTLKQVGELGFNFAMHKAVKEMMETFLQRGLHDGRDRGPDRALRGIQPLRRNERGACARAQVPGLRPPTLPGDNR